jgi:hypothetical protein
MMKFSTLTTTAAIAGYSCWMLLLSVQQPVDAFAPPLSSLGSRSGASRASSSTATDGVVALNMVARNPNFAKLAGGYLFPEIGRRRSLYVADHPEQAARIISLGIGDTTQPIPPHILSGLTQGAAKLGTSTGYTGYGDVQGRDDLRAKIAETLYQGRIDADEVFVSGTLHTVHSTHG